MSGKKVDLNRTNSICPPPETVLYDSVLKNELDTIKILIRNNPALLKYKYVQTDKTILPSACSESGVSGATIRALIELGGDVNGDSEWKPLHIAAKNPNSEVLEAVVQKLQPGLMNDTLEGENALHSLIKGVEDAAEEDPSVDEASFTDNVRILLKSGIDVNLGDGNYISPILFAAKYGYKTIIKTILDESPQSVDLDSHKLRGKTAREWLKEKKLYDGPLPQAVIRRNPSQQLFDLIKQSKEAEFVNYFESLFLTNPSDFINSNDGSLTFLQYSCEKGLPRIVEFLLQKGANVNLSIHNKPDVPLQIAATHGFHKIFKSLIDHPNVEIPPNLLSELLKKFDSPKFDGISHEECAGLLLKKRDFTDLNEADGLKNTPLRYAARYANDATTEELLNRGASLAAKNRFGFMPIEEINPEVLEHHLDHCIDFDLKQKQDDKTEFEITIDYKALLPPRQDSRRDKESFKQSSNIQPESEAVAYMSQAPELKHLLKHPVIVSFLFMKWHRIRWLFYTNLFFYVVFVASLMCYIFSYYVFHPSNCCATISSVSWVLLNLSFWVLTLRELFQMLVSPRHYFCSFENFVEVILIILTGFILYLDGPSEDTRKQLSSIVILLAAFELVLMVGHHPKLSTNVVMLKTVSSNFFKLLLWYSLLIIAFALSFYIIFAEAENEHETTNATEATDAFRGPGKSVFKTIVMLTGEFDASSINFETYPVTSKLIFSLFIFMIVIILLNLLNGLAVSDTQSIKNDAELVGHISRAQYIFYVESMVLGNIIPTRTVRILRDFFCCCPLQEEANYAILKPFVKNVCLFSNSTQLFVTPNDEGRIYADFGAGGKKKQVYNCRSAYANFYLDKTTVRRITAIVKRKRIAFDSSVSTYNIEDFCAKIGAMQKELEKMLLALANRS